MSFYNSSNVSRQCWQLLPRMTLASSQPPPSRVSQPPRSRRGQDASSGMAGLASHRRADADLAACPAAQGALPKQRHNSLAGSQSPRSPGLQQPCEPLGRRGPQPSPGLGHSAQPRRARAKALTAKKPAHGCGRESVNSRESRASPSSPCSVFYRPALLPGNVPISTIDPLVYSPVILSC